MQKLGVCFGILSRITAAGGNQRIQNTNINFFPPFPLLGFMGVDSDISPRQARLFTRPLHYTDYTYLEQIDKRASTLSVDRSWAISAVVALELRFYFGHQLSAVRRQDLRGDVRKALEKSVGWDLTETSHLVRYLAGGSLNMYHFHQLLSSKPAGQFEV